MEIVGSGLIARSLAPYAALHEDVLADAAGVSRSNEPDARAYGRELSLVDDLIRRAKARDMRLVYFTGGGAVYGRWATSVAEDAHLHPQSRYGQHQIICERRIRESGVRHIIVRLPNVVGPTSNTAQLVPNLVTQCLKGRVNVQARAERDLIGSDDTASIISRLLELQADRYTVNVASGQSVPVTLLVAELNELLATRPIVVRSEVGEAQRFDTSLMCELLGYDPFATPGYFHQLLQRNVSDIVSWLTYA